jgi:exodeoxyribonuclease VII large subunit
MAEPILPELRQRERRVLSPVQLNTLARELLEGAFAQVWVEGEISNFARPASGHLYFTLKDEHAQVRCAMFRMKATGLRFTPRNGLKVLVRGRLTLYEARGEYQLVLEHMEEGGEGALRRAFEELKARLAAEGLFEAARKRPLPRFARHLGLITSARGAAVRDVLTVLARRWPLLAVDVLPVSVQGATAAAEIRAMLEGAAASGRYDVLLITRGGGSLEDLWSFNDEALARAIVASVVPVVSAVGHEIDFSLSDFAADLRAATPSAAAELLVPDRAELQARLRQLHGRLDAAMQRRLSSLAQRSDRAGLRLESLHPRMRLERGRHRLDVLGQRLDVSMRRRLEQRGQRLELLARTLASVSPLATLARGYAVLRDTESGAVLRRAADARAGQALDAQLAEGRLRLRVDGEIPPEN